MAKAPAIEVKSCEVAPCLVPKEYRLALCGRVSKCLAQNKQMITAANGHMCIYRQADILGFQLDNASHDSYKFIHGGTLLSPRTMLSISFTLTREGSYYLRMCKAELSR